VFVTRQNRDQNSNLRNQDEDNKNTFSRQGCSSQGAHEHYAAPVFIPLPLPSPSLLPQQGAGRSPIPGGCGAEPRSQKRFWYILSGRNHGCSVATIFVLFAPTNISSWTSTVHIKQSDCDTTEYSLITGMFASQ